MLDPVSVVKQGEAMSIFLVPQKSSQRFLRSTFSFMKNWKCLSEISGKPSEACRSYVQPPHPLEYLWTWLGAVLRSQYPWVWYPWGLWERIPHGFWSPIFLQDTICTDSVWRGIQVQLSYITYCTGSLFTHHFYISKMHNLSSPIT